METVISMKETGGMVSDMVKVFMSTRMVIFMRDSGFQTTSKATENWIWQLAIDIRANGLLAKRMEPVFLL